MKLIILILTVCFHAASSSLVVTLGDGFASGAGIHTLSKSKYEDGVCLRESETSPGGRYATAVGLEHINLACADDSIGAAARRWDELNARYPAEATSGWDGSLVLTTVGLTGVFSDINRDGEIEVFYVDDIITRCLARPFCNISPNGLWDDVFYPKRRLRDYYTKLAMEAPQATIRAVGYPTLFGAEFSRFCFLRGISRREAAQIDSIVAEFNAQTASVIAEVKQRFPYVDIQFVDNSWSPLLFGACTLFPWRSGINRPLFTPTTVLASSFRPNQRGYDATYRNIVDALV